MATENNKFPHHTCLLARIKNRAKDFDGSPYIDFHDSGCYGAQLWNQEM